MACALFVVERVGVNGTWLTSKRAHAMRPYGRRPSNDPTRPLNAGMSSPLPILGEGLGVRAIPRKRTCVRKAAGGKQDDPSFIGMTVDPSTADRNPARIPLHGPVSSRPAGPLHLHFRFVAYRALGQMLCQTLLCWRMLPRLDRTRTRTPFRGARLSERQCRWAR